LLTEAVQDKEEDKGKVQGLQEQLLEQRTLISLALLFLVVQVQVDLADLQQVNQVVPVKQAL
jgi:hypothetical protein